jgi:hypothetical protein
MKIVESGRKRENEVVPGKCVLSVAAVDRVSSEGRCIAEIFGAVGAIPAVAVDAADPGDSDPGADRRGRRGSLDNFADDLVAGDHGLPARRQFSFDNM